MRMKKYLALYLASQADFEKMMKEATPEQQKAGMEEWNSWMEKHKKEMVDPGMPVGKTMLVTKGKIESTKNEVGGYSIVQADSLDEAAKIFTDSAHFSVPSARIEVMELMEMPGM